MYNELPQEPSPGEGPGLCIRPLLYSPGMLGRGLASRDTLCLHLSVEGASEEKHNQPDWEIQFLILKDLLGTVQPGIVAGDRHLLIACPGRGSKPDTYSFDRQIFIEHLWGAGICSRFWGYISE